MIWPSSLTIYERGRQRSRWFCQNTELPQLSSVLVIPSDVLLLYISWLEASSPWRMVVEQLMLTLKGKFILSAVDASWSNQIPMYGWPVKQSSAWAWSSTCSLLQQNVISGSWVITLIKPRFYILHKMSPCHRRLTKTFFLNLAGRQLQHTSYVISNSPIYISWCRFPLSWCYHTTQQQ